MNSAPDTEALYAPRYPLFMDIANKRVVVIGGGEVAQRKIETLLEYGAQIFVVAIQATNRIVQLSREGAITLEQRAYASGDLNGATLAFCACGVPEVEEEICAEAQRLGCPINVVDVPEKCGFIVPSVVSRGPLQIAISTLGTAPTEAKKIRKQLEEEFDESWAAYLKLMGEVRLLIKQRIAGGEPQRRPYYEAASNASWRQRLATGESISTEEAYQEACERVEVQS